ncbi:MAG: HAD family phosphatase [Thermomicrobiales bacterium]|nr:HAD family phosphatase [Thermomicrobiales bacterium]
MSRLQGVLCDMDGTLVDSEPYWERAKLDLMASHGVPFTAEEAATLVGKSMMFTVHFLQGAGLRLSDQEILDALVDDVAARIRAHMPWLPGAEDFLQRMKAEGVPCALVTQGWPAIAQQIVDASDGALQTMVTGDEVMNPKPHPEPYLTAATRLGVDIAGCIAIEDSPSGVESAASAGATVLVMPGVHAVPEGPRRIHRESLIGVDGEYLESLF